MREDIKNFTLTGLKDYFSGIKLPAFYAQQIFDWLYKKRNENFDKMTNLPKDLRHNLKDKFYFSSIKLLKQEISVDGTQKFLFALGDNLKIESVLIPEKDRSTLCVSTQAGCKFKCKFCLSGQKGFKRNLTAAEIINQYLFINDSILPRKITNIVFMGIGEPLDNFTNTVNAIKIFMEPAGLGFAKRKICISTCGLAPQIKVLGRLKLGIKLSVSLHAPDDTLRSKIMPVNKQYPLAELIKAVKDFSGQEKYTITFEYAMLSTANISKKQALELARLLRNIPCKINLIPYNRSSINYNVPSLAQINDFCQTLKEKGVFFTLRKSRGGDINAACGQLRALWE